MSPQERWKMAIACAASLLVMLLFFIAWQYYAMAYVPAGVCK